MEANEIRRTGQKIKSWSQPDGAWYHDDFEIWQVGDRFYQIQNHCSHSFSATLTFYGKVTEINEPVNKPTHIGVVLGSKDGKVWIVKQMQGTLEEIDTLYGNYIEKASEDKSVSYSFKTLELHF